MLVYFALGNAQFWRWVHCLTPTPDARYLAFWWNISLNPDIVYVRSKIYMYAQKNMKGTLKPIFHCDANTIRVGSSRWLRPLMPQFPVGDSNMLVSKNAKICVTPNANPQREQVEYRWRWVPNALFSCWPCRFHVVCVNFVCAGWPTRTHPAKNVTS